KLLDPKPVGSKAVCPKCTANFTVPDGQLAATQTDGEAPCEQANDAAGTGLTRDPAPLFKPFGSFNNTPQEPIALEPAAVTPKPAVGSNTDQDLPGGKPKAKKLEKKKAPEGGNLVLMLAGGTVAFGILVVAGLLVFLLSGRREQATEPAVAA